MRIFAIDTAIEACSAAVLDTERGAILARESVPMARGHAEALMPLIKRVRAATPARRGMGPPAGKPVVGLSTLAAFAAPFIAADDTKPVVAVIDARHEHVYLQVFGPGGHTLV